MGGSFFLVAIGIVFIFFLWLKSYRSPQILGKCIHSIHTQEKVVALTFDDGPCPSTPVILDMLRQEEIKATFFLIGRNIEHFFSLIQPIYQEGHEIGNHSYSHQPLIFQSLSFIQQEIEKTDHMIRNAGYLGPIHFRAPYGRKLLGLPWILWKAKRPHILFDVVPDDWAQPGTEVIIKRILSQVKPGSIILCHEGENSSQTIEALEVVIPYLKKEGYRWVTISELLQLDSTSNRS